MGEKLFEIFRFERAGESLRRHCQLIRFFRRKNRFLKKDGGGLRARKYEEKKGSGTLLKSESLLSIIRGRSGARRDFCQNGALPYSRREGHYLIRETKHEGAGEIDHLFVSWGGEKSVFLEACRGAEREITQRP